MFSQDFYEGSFRITSVAPKFYSNSSSIFLFDALVKFFRQGGYFVSAKNL